MSIKYCMELSVLGMACLKDSLQLDELTLSFFSWTFGGKHMLTPKQVLHPLPLCPVVFTQ